LLAKKRWQQPIFSSIVLSSGTVPLSPNEIPKTCQNKSRAVSISSDRSAKGVGQNGGVFNLYIIGRLK
jgi:hypothetical protein